jgi:hypothetical protein
MSKQYGRRVRSERKMRRVSMGTSVHFEQTVRAQVARPRHGGPLGVRRAHRLGGRAVQQLLDLLRGATGHTGLGDVGLSLIACL